MSNTYFLALALPENEWEHPVSINWEEVDQLLKDNLTEGDYAQIQTLRSSQFSGNEKGFLKQLSQFNEAFIQQTTLFRAQRLGKACLAEDGEALPGLNALLEKYVSTPLLLHQKLLEYRLQSLARPFENPFSFDQLLYRIWRLLAIDEWTRLDQEKGIQILRRIA